MDPQTRETGGDIGWARRGENVAEFDRWLFGSSFVAALQPGQMSPVVELPLGYYIIRVDRVQPGEVKAHQIVIAPKIDSLDVARARQCREGGWASDIRHAREEIPRLPAEEHPDAVGARPTPNAEAFLLHKPQKTSSFQIPGQQRPDVRNRCAIAQPRKPASAP
jgi:hypothetical protein